MPGIDPVTAVAEAIKEIAATIRMAFNGNNRKILDDLKDVKNMRRALDTAEKIFMISDKEISTKDYVRLREKFNKYD